MWWRIFRWRRRKLTSSIIKIFILSILMLSSIFVICFWIITQNQIAFWLLKQKANSTLEGMNRTISSTYNNNLHDRYEDIVDNDNNDGIRGNGLNILLIDRITAEGYAKELLSLYRDSSEGKLHNTAYNFPMEGLLGKHANETGYYGGTPLLRSYLPYSNGEVSWGREYLQAPAEAMKLRSFNTTAAKLANINYTYQRMSSTGKYVNAFQIDNSYFRTSLPSNLMGYNHNFGRVADPFFLPDSLSYIDQQYSSMIVAHGLEDEEEIIRAGAYSIYHNGGGGHFAYSAGFGTTYSANKVYNVPRSSSNSDRDVSIRNEYSKHTTTIVKDMSKGLEKYTYKLNGLNSSSTAVLLLLEQGYYLSPKGYDVYTCRYQGNTEIGCGLSGGMNRSDQMVESWEALYGERLTKKEISEKLSLYRKTITEVHGDYINVSDLSKIYGQSDDVNRDPKGAIWKLSENTSSNYRNKLKGENPRVLHITNAEVIGHVFDTIFTGKYVYVNMLKFAGVDIDPTNPQDYMEKIENEFLPPGNEFSDILKRIGVTDIPPDVYDMLLYGYNISGFWYYLGGQGLEVSQKNWDSHARFRYSSQPTSAYGRGELSNKVLTETIYATKDGTRPQDSEENRRDDNLINFGKILLDCSQLIYQAFNNTIGNKTGNRLLEMTSAGQYVSSSLVTINDWEEVKIGDIFVRNGHVFFFLSKNEGNSLTTLSREETRTEKDESVRVGGYWVLEASDYNTKVGIRSRSYINKKQYILRRFIELQ